MKIHFEGRHHELERVSLFLEECGDDVVVMETSKIKEKGDNSRYYYLDVETISAIPKTPEDSLYFEEEYDDEEYDEDNIRYQYYHNTPSSQMAMYKYGFWDIVEYVRLEPDASKEEIVKLVLKWYEDVIGHKKAIEEFERKAGDDYED